MILTSALAFFVLTATPFFTGPADIQTTKIASSVEAQREGVALDELDEPVAIATPGTGFEALARRVSALLMAPDTCCPSKGFPSFREPYYTHRGSMQWVRT